MPVVPSYVVVAGHVRVATQNTSTDLATSAFRTLLYKKSCQDFLEPSLTLTSAHILALPIRHHGVDSDAAGTQAQARF